MRDDEIPETGPGEVPADDELLGAGEPGDTQPTTPEPSTPGEDEAGRPVTAPDGGPEAPAPREPQSGL